MDFDNPKVHGDTSITDGLVLAYTSWRWQQTTVELMVFVKHSETQSKGVAVSLQGLVLAKRVNICKSLTTVS